MPRIVQTQVTSNYDEFVILGDNREIVDGHVKSIRKAFEEKGNITAKQPLLVNERMEIIDGQHRFNACKELGLPVYFTVHEGLTIADARSMNILHRSWKADDFALSYANGGNRQYQKYLELKEDYGFGHSIMMAYIVGENRKGMYNWFRDGELTIEDEAAARVRLDKLTEAGEVLGGIANQYFAMAYLQVMRVRGFDQNRMIRKFRTCGDNYMRKFGSAVDYMRAMEEVYNYMTSETNRLRLY